MPTNNLKISGWQRDLFEVPYVPRQVTKAQVEAKIAFVSTCALGAMIKAADHFYWNRNESLYTDPAFDLMVKVYGQRHDKDQEILDTLGLGGPRGRKK